MHGSMNIKFVFTVCLLITVTHVWFTWMLLRFVFYKHELFFVCASFCSEIPTTHSYFRVADTHGGFYNNVTCFVILSGRVQLKCDGTL
jgi:hypothetical protein